MNELYEWQRIDETNGLIECWFTHGALDEIKKMDLSNKTIVAFGGGLGDIWLANRCKQLHVIERNFEWLDKLATIASTQPVNNLFYHHRPCNDCSGMDEYYCEIPEGLKVDVLINDDAYRYEVIVKALTLPRPLVLITDNWMQSYVFICPAGVELLKDFESHIHEQADHLHNDGINKWKTAIHFIK